MGWTGIQATYHKINGQVDRKAQCDAINSNWPEHTILKSGMVGTTYYAAIKNTHNGKNEVYAIIYLTKVNTHNYHQEFLYKDISEYMGPCETKCPLSILKLLTPTEDEIALRWRKKCYEHHGKKMPLTTKAIEQKLF